MTRDIRTSKRDEQQAAHCIRERKELRRKLRLEEYMQSDSSEQGGDYAHVCELKSADNQRRWSLSVSWIIAGQGE